MTDLKMVDQDWSRKDPAAEARNRIIKGTLYALQMSALSSTCSRH